MFRLSDCTVVIEGEEVKVQRLRVAARPCQPGTDGKGKGKAVERERKERAPRRKK
jgi:hypothetical protein